MNDFVLEREKAICNYLDENKFVYFKKHFPLRIVKNNLYDYQLNVFVNFPLKFFIRVYFNFSKRKIVYSFLDKTISFSKAVYFDMSEELFSHLESFLFNNRVSGFYDLFSDSSDEQLKFDI